MSSPDPAFPLSAVDLLADLHARYDGRPPRRARAVALAGGEDSLQRVLRRARAERLRMQCAVARLAVARRRRQLPAARTQGDAWLRRLTATLRTARDQAVSQEGASAAGWGA
ncbi:hypothetical protein [Niveispirillum fermenti]|uniref:hypothetical protein n=1 Tax=Niveispirillum fermenti TaxID=1233113 RepID=UPI003A861A7D